MNVFKILQPLEYGRSHNEVFKSFLIFASSALSVGRREKQYLEEAKKYNSEEMQKFAEAFGQLVVEMEEKPHQDLLGDYYMGNLYNSDRQYRGVYFTPQPVCDMMAEMVSGFETDERPIKVHEPACGSGRMILSIIKQAQQKGISPFEFRVEAWDIGAMCAQMTMINLSLWAIPARIVQGNTLTLEIFDTYETPFLNQGNRVALMANRIASEAPQEPVKGNKPHINLGELHEQLSLF